MATDHNASFEESSAPRIENLVHQLEQIADPASRETAEGLMRAVLDLYGTGLEKMLELAFESGASGEALIRRFANDGLISSLLVLHGLHPDDLETRIRRVLAKIPGRAELIGIFEGVARVRFASEGCSSNQMDEASLKKTLQDAVPDLAEVIVQHSTPMNGFVPLLSLNGAASRAG